jgi:ubiquinone/menaquinone biosynthesis C-methylase UbiE
MRMTQTSTILKCPITGDSLHFVEPEAIDRLRAQLSSQVLRHLDGSEVSATFDAFLQTSKGNAYYPILHDILILLPAFAILGREDREAYAARMTNADTLLVMRFYDQVGWKKADSGVFYDADINEDFRDVSSRYIRDCHLRVRNHLPPRGDYILDIASGPVQYDEYLTYSAEFDRRICCDVSFEALRSAKARIGEKGIYIQCDITNIPLKDGVVDAFVSLHTVYHVPANRQIEAFRELERVTREGGGGVVVYSWGDHSLAMKLLASPTGPLRSAVRVLRSTMRAILPDAVVRQLRRNRLRPTTDLAPAGAPQQSASHFCYHAHDYSWYRQQVASGNWTLHSWRSLSVEFLERYIRDGAFGRLFLGFIFWLENVLPDTLGRIGQYPMFVFRKGDRSIRGGWLGWGSRRAWP